MTERVEGCSYDNTPCVEQCIYKELDKGEVGTGVVLPQCVFACEQGDKACVTVCGYYLQ